MNPYQSGSAFRRALEDRLKANSLDSGIPLPRLRKMVVFDRFLARLMHLQPDHWVLKGGFAIELRLVSEARTTKDIDLAALAANMDIYTSLRSAGSIDLDDWFLFEVRQSQDHSPDKIGGQRFYVRALLDSRVFEEFHIDVGMGDPIIDSIDHVEGISLLEFAGLKLEKIPCYPLTQQIAEKIHAYTRPHISGVSSRVKDFVDILLLARLDTLEFDRLLRALHATFDFRSTHTLPREFPDPPADWSRPYQSFASQVSLGYRTLEDANKAIKAFVNPILSGDEVDQWDPSKWAWV